MRCYAWIDGALQEGIELADGTALILGTQSEQGNPVRIPLHKRNPAELTHLRISNSYPFWVNPQSGEPFLTFAQPHEKHENDTKTLLHVSTLSGVNHDIQGFWKGVKGHPKTLLVGIGATQKKSWKEGLVVLEPGDVLRVRPEGSDDMWAVVHTGHSLRSETWIRHEARGLLLEEGIL
jgi:hypothetical protein